MTDEDNAPGIIERRNSRTPSIHQQDVGFEWNDSHETLLKKWQERSENYGQLHDLAGKQFSRWNSWLGLPTKLLLVLIATIEFSQLSTINNSDWSFYFNGFVALLSLLFETAQDYLGWTVRSTKHFSAAAIYDKLAMNIETELCHPRDKRTNVRAFLRYSKNTLQNLKETAPDIPSAVLTLYVTKVQQEDEKAKIKEILPPVVITVPTVPPTVPDESMEDNPDTDLQDEFANEMQRKLEAKKERIEQYQVQRFNE